MIRRPIALFILTAVLLTTVIVSRTAPALAAAKPKVPIAHLAFSQKTIAFGMVSGVTTKTLTIKNTGSEDANVVVNEPAGAFSVTAGGGSLSIPAQGSETISIQFAPTTKGLSRSSMKVQCANCNTAANRNVAINLRGKSNQSAGSSAAGSANALPISVTAGPFNASDEPFASVTICATGSSQCTVVNDVLVDTGSYGLRIFGSQLGAVDVSPNRDGSGEVGQCAFFGSGWTWGSVSTVDVKIAGEPTITIPIQVMDDVGDFASAPRDCARQGGSFIDSPNVADFNGILGVGQASSDVLFTTYYSCSGENCSQLGSPPSAVVLNPVSSFPVDNNGVVVKLPSVPAGGQQTANGTLYFGIGTESNNQPGSVAVYQEGNDSNNPNDYLDISTVYKGQAAPGFFDTGSNGYFFNDVSIAFCPDNSGYYCPSGTLSDKATNQSVGGNSASGVVSFKIANADNLLETGHAALNDIGATYDGGDTYDGFDWGLPFFLGRSVFISMASASTPLGEGPYTAY